MRKSKDSIKTRVTVVALLGLSFMGLMVLPYTARASGVLQETEVPPATVESCLTLQPDEQSDCFATKAAIGEIQQQTQEVLGITATAQAIEQDIQGTLQAGQAEETPVPPPTEVPITSTAEGFVVPVPGLNVELNLVSLIGLGVCAVGGVVLIALGFYLVRSNAGGDQEEEGGPQPAVARASAEGGSDIRPLVADPVPPPMPEIPSMAARPSAQPMPSVEVPPLPPADMTLAEHRMQAAAAPGMSAVLVSQDGHQVRVTSGDFSIGRAFENDFVVDARFPGYDNVSAEHARLVQDASQRWLIEDLGSANGTYVNGRPTSMNVLQDGWRLAFGPVEFTFRLIASEEQR